MADRRTLLQRLHRPDPGAYSSESELLARSVRDNLEDLFSTQWGACQAEPDYGFPPLSVLIHSFDRPLTEEIYQHGVEQLKRALRTAIQTYEPRLELRSIEACVDPADPTFLRFDLRARLLLDGRDRGAFHVSAVVNPHGHLEIS
jgi:type VI secretion system lysozyme-like protein